MSISVVIPVGPYPENTEWLDECLDSVANQTYLPQSVVLIDDMSTTVRHLDNMLKDRGFYPEQRVVWEAPWRLGVAHAFNFGVALAPTECVFMLGSDDTLEPNCLAACWDSYQQNKIELGYYWVPIRYMDTGEHQALPCNAAMVTKSLWRHNGGFPVEAVTAPDAALLSIMMGTHQAGYIIRVGEKPLYNYRRHPGTDTARHGAWDGIRQAIRDRVTAEWEPPTWAR